MSETYTHIPRKYVFRVGLVTLFSTLILWIFFNIGAGALSGIDGTAADGAAWGALSAFVSLIRVLPFLLVGLIIMQILWTPVYALLSKAGTELPLSAMLTAALLSGLPVLIAFMVLGRITFYYFPLPVALFALVTSVVLARRYSFDRDGAIRT